MPGSRVTGLRGPDSPGRARDRPAHRAAGNRSLAAASSACPRTSPWTQPQPLLVAAALELSGADGVPGSAALAAAERILERLPADRRNSGPAGRRADQAGRFPPGRRSRCGGGRGRQRRRHLLGQITGRRLAQHPEIHAQVLSRPRSGGTLVGRLDRRPSPFVRPSPPASAPGGMYRAQADCLGYLALVEALRGRLSHAAELADEAAGAAENQQRACRVRQTRPRTVALAYVHL